MSQQEKMECVREPDHFSRSNIFTYCLCAVENGVFCVRSYLHSRIRLN